MKKNYLKSLFKEKKFDWDSVEYKKKSLKLIKDCDNHNYYEDMAHNKKNFEERFNKLIKD